MSKFNIDDRVVITNRGEGWDGVTGTVTKVLDDGSGAPAYHVLADSNSNPAKQTGIGSWSECYLKALPVSRFDPGDIVRITKVTPARCVGTEREFDLRPGARLQVAEHVEEFGQYRLTFLSQDIKDTERTFWVNDEDVESDSNPRPRAALQHQTSRDYAKDSQSAKLLTDEQNRILLDAAQGKKVDVFDFRKAATAALSAATTRAGQSYGRREYAKKARHLIHWADAILENHVNGLPAYEPGERSPKIKALEAEVRDLRENNDAIREQWKAEAAKAKKDLASANREIEDLQAGRSKEVAEALAKANEEVKALTEALQGRDRNVARLTLENNILVDVFHYMSNRLPEHEAGRLHGYWDAQRDIRREQRS